MEQAITTKTCTKCKQERTLDEFYKSARYKCGRVSICRHCQSARIRNLYKNSPEFKAVHRARVAAYKKRPLTKELLRVWRREYYKANQEQIIDSRRRNRQKHTETVRRYAKQNKDKLRARSLVNQRINRGKLKREPCIVCKNPKGEAHHPDHSKPLDVVWLCRKHHRAWERVFC